MIEKLRKYVNLDKIGSYIPLPADLVTALSLAVALGGLPLVWIYGVPAWLLIGVVGLLDVLDGAVARAKGTAGRPGALLDSALDRYTDSVILLYFYWAVPPLITYASLVGTFLISYVRARAESLGLSMRGVGFMERAERLIYLICASLLGVFDKALLVWALYLYAVLVNVAAALRILLAYRALRR